MIDIVDKSKCCGCTACYNSCPRKAIQMKVDFEGFLYPSVDQKKCIECGKCVKVCPITKELQKNNFSTLGAVVRCKDKKALYNSSSGGLFTPVARFFLRENGIVIAARYDKDFKVVHSVCKKTEQIPFFRGSKYVQSELGSCFTFVKKELDKGKQVCFIGTTCQVYGLKAFLGREYEKLFTIDLVCHGTPSPKLWKKYLEYQQNKFNSKIKSVNFRSKRFGYHVASLEIIFENGKRYCASARSDLMLKAFFSEIASRPSCYDCHFKSLERKSDITVFDAWHAGEISKEIRDDDKGYTNLIIHNERGLKLVEQIKDDLDVYWVDPLKAVSLDGPMVLKSAVPHPLRQEFYLNIDDEELLNHCNRFIPISRSDKLIDVFKNKVARFGILYTIKKVLKR